MADNVKHFDDATEQSGGTWIHVSELISFLHELDFGDIVSERKTISSPDGSRSIEYPPSRERAHTDILEALIDERGFAIIENALMNQIHKNQSRPIDTYEDDGVTTITSVEERKTVRALQSAALLHLSTVLPTIIHRTLREQFPEISRLHIDKLSLKLFEIMELRHRNVLEGQDGKSIEDLKRDSLDLLDRKIKRLKARHLGSEWVKLSIRHDLTNVVQRGLSARQRFMHGGEAADDDTNVVRLGEKPPEIEKP